MVKSGENRKETDRVRKHRWRQRKDNVPQDVIMQCLRDVFRVYLIYGLRLITAMCNSDSAWL